MGKTRHAGEQIQKAPAPRRWNWPVTISASALPHRINQPDQADDDCGKHGYSQKCVGDAAVLNESNRGALEVREYVDVRCFGSKRHGDCGERGLAIKSRSGEGGSGEKVGDGLHLREIQVGKDCRESQRGSANFITTSIWF